MGSVWRDARSIADLGRTMADWLEGRIPSWPGYDGAFGQEEEDGARHLIPTLAAVNRVGFVTVDSQPGTVSYDSAGEVTWRQRAYVQGVIDRRNPLLDRLIKAARSEGMTVRRGTRRPVEAIVLTEVRGEPFTGITTKLRRNYLAREWNGIGRHALKELRTHGVHLLICDQVWASDRRLWPLLQEAVR